MATLRARPTTSRACASARTSIPVQVQSSRTSGIWRPVRDGDSCSARTSSRDRTPCCRSTRIARGHTCAHACDAGCASSPVRTRSSCSSGSGWTWRGSLEVLANRIGIARPQPPLPSHGVAIVRAHRQSAPRRWRAPRPPSSERGDEAAGCGWFSERALPPRTIAACSRISGATEIAVALEDFLPSSKSTCTLKSCESKSLGRGATVPAPRLWGRTSLFPEESRCPCEPVRPSVSPAPGARGPALAPLARSRGSRCCPELIAEFGVPRGLP